VEIFQIKTDKVNMLLIASYKLFCPKHTYRNMWNMSHDRSMISSIFIPTFSQAVGVPEMLLFRSHLFDCSPDVCGKKKKELHYPINSSDSTSTDID